MPKMIRFLGTRLNAMSGAHFCAPRKRARLRLRLAMIESNPHTRQPRTTLFDGYTRDISATGLAILLPIACFTEQLLNQGQRTLKIVLELATGVVEADASVVRHELVQVSEGPTEVGCLIGARILSMCADDRERFDEHLRSIDKPSQNGHLAFPQLVPSRSRGNS